MKTDSKHLPWYRVDNSGALYPMILTLNTQSLFRIGVELVDQIDKHDLINAVNETFIRYPYYKVELLSGVFRYSFMTNHRKITIIEDNGLLLHRIDFLKNNAYLLRISYYKRKIFVDFFHGLADGFSALEFLKTIIYCYYTKRGIDLPRDGIKIPGDIIDPEETSDAFIKYYKKIHLKEGVEKLSGENAFHIDGTFFKSDGYGLIHGMMSTEKLKALAKTHNCSITTLISAVALLSIAKCYENNTSKQDYTVSIPINLRRFFKTQTMMNFSTIAKIRVKRSDEPTLESYIETITAQLQEQLKIDDLDIKLSFTSLLYKKLFKFIPLGVKSLITRIGRAAGASSKLTMIISNLGEIKLAEEYNTLIDNFIFNLNCNSKTTNNIAMVSYNNKTVISFSRCIISTSIEQVFFSTLANMGLNINIVSNLKENQGP